ncbi:cathepsin B [Hyalella azteca]|uniref:Cathepsin B n=1 Tax=Hyalella azteca TaxID=294128 RepID=A0A8B7P419_HYAAZ|nr:cathepsin B [Hyalella azteca]
MEELTNYERQRHNKKLAFICIWIIIATALYCIFAQMVQTKRDNRKFEIISGVEPVLNWTLKTAHISSAESDFNVKIVDEKSSDPGIHFLSDEFIQKINSMAVSWKAGRNFPASASRESLKRLLGAKRRDRRDVRLAIKTYPNTSSSDLPENFDGREQWPDCPSLREIRNQGCCGSCWVFGAVEVMTDRQCILKKTQFRYSAEEPLLCIEFTEDYCSGGFPEDVYHYWIKSGIVSGGSFNSTAGCQPYEIDPVCPPDNSNKQVSDLSCEKSCQKNYFVSFTEDKHFGSESYALDEDKDIMRELFEKGPITVAFEVYEDFFNYKSGVYKHVSGSYAGGHAVKCLGYGVQDVLPYYLCANSWDYDWGDGGFFKIAMSEIEYVWL